MARDSQTPYMWTIEHKNTFMGEKWAVYQFTRYPRTSVLAGQECKTFVEFYDSFEEAQAAYPQAKQSHPLLQEGNTYDHLPDEPDY